MLQLTISFEGEPLGQYRSKSLCDSELGFPVADKYGKPRKRKKSKSKSPPCCITKLMNSSNLRFILETLITFYFKTPCLRYYNIFTKIQHRQINLKSLKCLDFYLN